MNALNEWRRMKADLPMNPNFTILDFKPYWVHFLNHRQHAPFYPILIKLCLLVVVDTSCCERGYSTMNIIHSERRSRLGMETLNDLMFIAMNGPPVAEFDAKPVFERWISEKRRKKVSVGNGLSTASSEGSEQTQGGPF